jgi:hypothetical protein
VPMTRPSDGLEHWPNLVEPVRFADRVRAFVSGNPEVSTRMSDPLDSVHGCERAELVGPPR